MVLMLVDKKRRTRMTSFVWLSLFPYFLYQPFCHSTLKMHQALENTNPSSLVVNSSLQPVDWYNKESSKYLGGCFLLAMNEKYM